MSLLNQLAPNALTRDDIEVKDGEDGELPSTFVPGRNLLFLSFAGVLARQIGAKPSLRVYVKQILADILIVVMPL